MDDEFPDRTLKALLMVSEGPPSGVWARALQAAFEAGQAPTPDEADQEGSAQAPAEGEGAQHDDDPVLTDAEGAERVLDGAAEHSWDPAGAEPPSLQTGPDPAGSDDLGPAFG